jgi:hypothetical protein
MYGPYNIKFKKRVRSLGGGKTVDNGGVDGRMVK